MEREEIIKLINEARFHDGTPHMFEELIELFEKTINASLPTVTEWVDVKERLPKFNETVLVVNSLGKIDFSCVDSTGKFDTFPLEAYHFTHPNQNIKITHWMPLPNPPKI